MIEVARPAEDAGADVVVEVARQRADLEPHLGDRLLGGELDAGPPRAEREEDARPSAGQRLGRAGEEEPRSVRRVRRVGDDRVEPTRERRRQRLA